MDQIRGDLELDHRLAQPLRQRRPFRRFGFEDHDALVLVGESQLLLGADHAFRADAADRARFQRAVDLPIGVAVDQSRPGQRQRDRLALRDVGRAGDDLKSMLAGIDRRQDQAIRVRVPFHRFDVADVDLVPRIADDRDLLGFQTGHRQAVGELLDRQTGVDEFREPAQRNFHRHHGSFDTECRRRLRLRARANWRRKRRSLPANARTSSTPDRIIVRRSMPSPKAKPL